MNQSDILAPQRVAFAIAASLLVHALLLPEFSGGTLKLLRPTGKAPMPLRVSMRTVVVDSAATRIISAGRNQGTGAHDEPTLPLHAGAASSAPARTGAASTDLPIDPVPAAAMLPPNPEQSPVFTALPEESSFGSYRALTEVDVRPWPMVQVEPKFPTTASQELPGKALLLVLIGNDGLVDQVRVLASDPGADFGESAKAAFEQARFTPAQVGGTPVPSYLTIEVNFG